jgi:predicted Zn-dependent protease
LKETTGVAALKRNPRGVRRAIAEFASQFGDGLLCGRAAAFLTGGVAIFSIHARERNRWKLNAGGIGPCAVVSMYRLRQDFYGLQADEELLMKRLLKESVHELGHTLGVSHCDDYRCVMAPSHAVEWIDLKEARLCGKCWGVAAR